METDKVWDSLPPDEHRSVWDETEHNFWKNFETEQEAQVAKAENEFQKSTSDTRFLIASMTGKRSQLVERREWLAKELSSIDREIACLNQACDEKCATLALQEREFRRGEQERLENRDKIRQKMQKFFKLKRKELHDTINTPRVNQSELVQRASSDHDQVIVSSSAQPSPTLIQPRRTPLPNKDTRPLAVHQLVSTPATPAPVQDGLSTETIVNVTDADGNVIGPVKRIEPWNQWVREILHKPIKRSVKIRRGRKFNQDHLASIYDRSEGKGVKWLSCMIQATGDILPQRCHSCDKNQGAFDDCIVLGGPLFQKCGNCEWNRQGCHRPLMSRSSNAGTPQREQPIKNLDEHEAAADEAMAASKAEGPSIVALDGLGPSAGRRDAGQHASSGFTPANGFTAANSGSCRPPSQDRSTPTANSVDGSPRHTPSESGEFLGEITRENLVLQHDGSVYTYPEIVEGVPVGKIDQTHPYWELGWPCIKSVIEPQLASWRDKNMVAQEAKARGEGGSSKFQTGRQVNRGIRILEFLESGEISPYQLVAKKFMNTGKGAIISYDTLFRLCETLSELAKFNLDVTPVEWLRHRLHEIKVEKGSGFNVSRTVHDFYHDPKLSALRSKNGFKNIGRPSGPKYGGGNGTPQGSLRKRKSINSQMDTPRGSPTALHSPFAVHGPDGYLQEHSLEACVALGDGTRREPPVKRLRPLSPPCTREQDEAFGQYADFSDIDSCSGAAVAWEDWRLYQVKTRLFTSSTSVTQYWNWKERERILEHQVLKETDPVSWGLYRDPIDFCVRLDDVDEVRWNVDALQVHLTMSPLEKKASKLDGRPRGDVLVAFKRERTIRRLLEFFRSKKIKLVEVSPEEMDENWGRIKSEKLPDNDDDASEELKE
ncbi:hypothetical protein CDD81_3801 [Ophiocordyceps australis]|uniref:Uncharacterized protein n=1 Tax=Ophiocordyceps australis TaxID=1399860 RepID=A0A2C5XUI7_9HYPO|nr:hypothetical protein CDD81_3801 [Ophiocordyceps australis]